VCLDENFSKRAQWEQEIKISWMCGYSDYSAVIRPLVIFARLEWSAKVPAGVVSLSGECHSFAYCKAVLSSGEQKFHA
jgi:hypothetical protein